VLLAIVIAFIPSIAGYVLVAYFLYLIAFLVWNVWKLLGRIG